MAKRHVRFSDQVRKAIRDCGLTQDRVARSADIAPETISRFLSGERGLSPRALDQLADFLRLRIVMDGPRRTAKKGR